MVLIFSPRSLRAYKGIDVEVVRQGPNLGGDPPVSKVAKLWG